MTRAEAIRILDPETTGEALKEIVYHSEFGGITVARQAILAAREMAVAALLRQEKRENRKGVDFYAVNKWIPVTERLPKTGRKCLITNGETVRVGWLRPDGVWKTGVNHNDLWNRFSLYPPTHWMPLPEPPKEDKK